MPLEPRISNPIVHGYTPYICVIVWRWRINSWAVYLGTIHYWGCIPSKINKKYQLVCSIIIPLFASTKTTTGLRALTGFPGWTTVTECFNETFIDNVSMQSWHYGILLCKIHEWLFRKWKNLTLIRFCYLVFFISLFHSCNRIALQIYFAKSHYFCLTDRVCTVPCALYG